MQEQQLTEAEAQPRPEYSRVYPARKSILYSVLGYSVYFCPENGWNVLLESLTQSPRERKCHPLSALAVMSVAGSHHIMAAVGNSTPQESLCTEYGYSEYITEYKSTP